MTPEELIEDMARATRTRLTVNVLRHAPQVGHGWLNELSVAMAADALSVVREAMREPSEEMLRAEDAAIPTEEQETADPRYAWGRVSWAAMFAASPLAARKQEATNAV